eukprot:TRINITY_DN323_c0_g3_i2.p1 TRINITY_DN323_c0_g3~~TRINITY_DN323_c0_g3_i2.p1  ORF type:complete len:157 (+),score=19.61 TRINITY_DN323_c0_g3_i2:171-641(+)
MWLGNKITAANLDLLEQLGITHIVCILQEPYNPHINRRYFNVIIEDDRTSDILVYFQSTCDFIQEAHEAGGKVFVHCNEGVSRSVTIAVAWLMKTQRFSLKEAFQYIIKVRNSGQYSHPNLGFFEQLQVFERVLFGKENSMSITDYLKNFKEICTY